MTEVLLHIDQKWLKFILRFLRKTDRTDTALSGQHWRGTHGNADYISMSCLQKKVYYNITTRLQLPNTSPHRCSVPLPSAFSTAATRAPRTGSAGGGRPASPRVLCFGNSGNVLAILAMFWHCSPLQGLGRRDGDGGSVAFPYNPHLCHSGKAEKGENSL